MSIHQEYLEVLDKEIAESERRLTEIRNQIDELTGQFSGLQTALADTRRLRQYVAIKAGVGLAQEKDAQPDEQAETATDGVGDGTPQRSHADAVLDILKSSERPLRVREIIEAVVASGHTLPSSEHQQYHAIYSALHRRKDLFLKNARSEWAVRVNGPADRPTPANGTLDVRPKGDSSSAAEAPTYSQAAETVIKEYGRHVRTSEIADWMIKKGYKNGEKRRYIRNTIYNCLDRSVGFYKDRDGQWGLSSELSSTPGSGAGRRSRAIDIS